MKIKDYLSYFVVGFWLLIFFGYLFGLNKESNNEQYYKQRSDRFIYEEKVKKELEDLERKAAIKSAIRKYGN